MSNLFAPSQAQGLTHLADDIVKELMDTAAKLSAPGKGFLAADESGSPWLRAGHAGAKTIPDNLDNRLAYRSMCFTTPGLSEHISGVILHKETLFQKNSAGDEVDMVKLIVDNGMLPGIKVDGGFDKLGLPGTATGPLGHPETWCKGIDDLEERVAAAYKKGARFAKWRNVVQIDPTKGIPSDLAIRECTHQLARYAAICQRQRVVPIVEPEVVPNGSHDISACADVTERVLKAQFEALKLHNVLLEGAVLKPNMVKNGLDGPRASPEEIADVTVQVLKRAVPAAMPGIFFLSGDTSPDVDNEETATVNLNLMNKRHSNLPWHLSFSYGKALQKTCIVSWMGKEENKTIAQTALLNRAKANGNASKGTYEHGTCASVGTDGNIKHLGGAY